mgnify:CR=1 FL=1
MLFKDISSIKKKAEKKNQFELVSIYCKIVRQLACKLAIPFTLGAEVSEKIIDELFEIGIISSKIQIPDLEKQLGVLYNEFISSIAVYVENKRSFGNTLDKLYNKKREELQKKESLTNKPSVADFFAGAGGLSLGFTHAGFKISFANDFEEVCINTYRYNHPEIPERNILQADIRDIVNHIDKYITEEIDVVTGGPPCQGFSSANQQRIIDDPRNELYKYFLKAVEKLAPKFVVMENVRGMLSVAGQVVEDYNSIRAKKNGMKYSYSVSYELLNAVNFSVAQNRERVIYIAIRNDVCEAKHITPQIVFEAIKEACKGNVTYSLADALAFIKPLEAPRVRNTNEIDSETTGKKVDVNTYSGRDNSYLSLINDNRIIPLTYNHKARYVNDINYDIYRLLNPGEDASDEKIADIMPYKNRLHCFKDKYYKLIPDKPSRTITAHLRMDCHSHIHPYQIRAITPREAARCQSFPDDYLFLGAYLKTYMEIGNAVPVLMAKQIAKIIKQYI